MEALKPKFILASASPRRLELLQRISIQPDTIIAADIDETVHHGESPKVYAKRMAVEKARAVAVNQSGHLVLGADTIVVKGDDFLGKPESESEACCFLQKLSGQIHQVYNSQCLVDTQGTEHFELSVSQVTFKELDADEIDLYLAMNEWQGKAGAYAIQGFAACFMADFQGSYTGVVGLSLPHTYTLLRSVGYV